MKEFLWTEKYRPKTIDECILPNSFKKTFQEFVNSKEIPNLLLSGSAGVGKTTVAKAMLNEINADYLMINGSLNGNIDTLRTDILGFASTVSFTSSRKYVILDEADYLNCFGGEQKIKIFDSNNIIEKSLESLKDMTVYLPSYNFDKNKLEITSGFIFENGEKEVFEVEFDDGSKMVCTSDHPFFDDKGKEKFIKDDVSLFNV